MHIPERVVNFLHRYPGQSFCDRCIQTECELKRPEQVARVTATLAVSPDYRRVRCECSRCASLSRLTTRTV